MKESYPYTCMETCKQEKHCGNRFCSAHPKYVGPKTKSKKGKPNVNKPG